MARRPLLQLPPIRSRARAVQVNLPFEPDALLPRTVFLSGDALLHVDLTPRGAGIFIQVPRREGIHTSWPDEVDLQWAEYMAMIESVEFPQLTCPPVIKPTHLTWEAEVCVVPPARARTPRVDGHLFTLLPGAERTGDEASGGVSALVRWLSDVVYESHGYLPMHLIRLAARLLRLASQHVATLCSAEGLRAARGFPPRQMMRWFIYQWVTNDPAGRVAQMTDVCPGLLILAKALHDRGRIALPRRLEALCICSGIGG